ncbi:MAG: non-heme iron oxygenase ferredoxin subunit [Candidatus Omnitrophica bacterium]|nr:non-heme iron oxygenase ferredoxin subunit [Candidatus Omnitrophota bacterium]
MADPFVPVATTNDIEVGQFKPVQVQDRHLLVCRTAEGFYVIDDTCTHDDGPLADGWLEGDAIECPRHGARFDVRTGKVLCLPAAVPVHSYPVKVEGGAVKVDVSQWH